MGAPGAQWGECLVPVVSVPAELATQVRRQIGATPGWLCRLAPSPWIARTLAANIGKPIAYAPAALCDLIGLVVSQDNSCRYCYGVQRAVLRILGYRAEYIDRIVGDFHAVVSPTDRTALEFARKLSRVNPRPGRADLAELEGAGFSAAACAELAALVAASAFANRVATLLALPFETLETMPDRPLFRLVRPLVAWQMRPRQRRPEPPPQPNEPPCAELVAALGDSPSATTLRRTLDEAWASPVFPRRTKALILAVIARAAGCTYSEAEARRLLEAEGIGRADLDEILANLGSPRLDAREARLVPFARETVRYQPAAIQRRMREMAQVLSAEEILELVGLVALANGICRLSVLLDAR